MMKKLTSGLFAAALVMALPLTADAQEVAVPADEVEICTATIAPIHAAEHVTVTATFDAPFGNVVAIEAPAESGLVLVAELPTEMAVEGELEGELEGEVEGEIEGEFEGEIEIEPTPLADENENVSTFWLNAVAAAPGTYLITLNNEAGASCTADITVEEKSDEWTETEAELEDNEAETDDTEDGEEY